MIMITIIITMIMMVMMHMVVLIIIMMICGDDADDDDDDDDNKNGKYLPIPHTWYALVQQPLVHSHCLILPQPLCAGRRSTLLAPPVAIPLCLPTSLVSTGNLVGYIPSWCSWSLVPTYLVSTGNLVGYIPAWCGWSLVPTYLVSTSNPLGYIPCLVWLIPCAYLLLAEH